MPSGTPVRVRWGAVILVLALFLVAVISNEGDQPGVSRRNSLPLPGTLGSGRLQVSGFALMPLDFCIEFCKDFRLDLGTYLDWKSLIFQKKSASILKHHFFVFHGI